MTTDTFMTRVLCGVAAFLLFPTLVFAQQGTIRGQVTEAQSGEALPGANVVVEGENMGAATQADGRYSIADVPAGEQTLVVSFVGFQRTERTVDVQAGETTVVNIQLQPDLTGLDEVVVTGLAQEQTRAEASVSVTSIDAADLTESGDYQSVDKLFQGNTPGVTVSSTSGNVGSGIRFNVRGGVSLNSDGQPTIYLDGTRINQDPIEGFGAGGQEISPLADLNPDNIKSVEVLKGPSAAALYGTDAADGVVLIETKSGQEGQATEATYSTTLGWQEQSRKFSEDRFISAPAANGLFRNGDITQHRASISGSFNSTNYFASFSNRVTEGVMRQNKGTRTNFRTNFDINPNDEWRVGASAGLTINDVTRPQNDNNTIGQLGNTLLAFGGEPYFFTDSTDVFGVTDQFRTQRFNGSIDVSYSPSPSALQGLRLDASVGADVSSVRQNQTFPASGDFDGIVDGERSLFETNNRQFNGELSASYNYKPLDDLSATTTGGAQGQTESTENAFLQVQQFGSEAITDVASGADIQAVGEDIFNRRSLGFFVRQSFTYQDTYSLSASFRRDFSTQLIAGDPDNDSFTAWYPNAQANVRFEQFDFTPDFFSQLKARVAFGQSGSLPDPIDIQELRLEGTASGFGTGAAIGSVGNPDLASETVNEIEGGLDIEVNSRYSLSSTFYYQETSDSFVNFDPAPSTGLAAGAVPRNVGRITGKGVETSLDATVFQTNKHRVSIGINHTWQTSEVQELAGQEISGGFDRNVIAEGFAPRSFVGLKVDGAQFTENGLFAGPNIVDQNGDGQITDADEVLLGEVKPDHFGGFNLNAQVYNNLTFSFRGSWQLGRSNFNNTQVFAVQFGNDPRINNLLEVLGSDLTGGTAQPGTEEYRQAANRFAELSSVANRDDIFSTFVQDSKFLKIREISLGYDFAPLVEDVADISFPLRTLRLRLSGSDLFTITPFKNPEPQLNSTGSRTVSSNQDFLTLGQPRSWTMTLSASF
jgi:TonB-dependent SusC/RagA subfamily outer membrane receptor